MRNNAVLWVFVGVVLGVLLMIVGVVVTGGIVSLKYRERAAAEQQRTQAMAEQAIRDIDAIQQEYEFADMDRRAAENAKPQPEEVKDAAVVIELKNDPGGAVIILGDGTTVRPKEGQVLADYLKAMRRDGKKQVELRVDGDAEWKTTYGVIEEAQKAGFEKIILQKRAQK